MAEDSGWLPAPADDPQRVNYERANAPQNLKLRGESATKPPVGIVPMHPLLGVSRVYEDSGIKYAPFNYMAQAVEEAIAAYDSAELRHRIASTNIGGEVTAASYATPDPDSGIPHIYHRIAGLLIVASLMIRDGVIPADPGMGKRKRAAVEASRAPSNPHLEQLKREQAELDNLRGLAERIAAREIEARHDPDAARRAAAEANIERIKCDAKEAAEQKRKWEQRCSRCNGTGKRARDARDSGPPDVGGYACRSCNGTGQRTGAEGVTW